jgi:hypothetical protein
MRMKETKAKPQSMLKQLTAQMASFRPNTRSAAASSLRNRQHYFFAEVRVGNGRESTVEILWVYIAAVVFDEHYGNLGF